MGLVPDEKLVDLLDFALSADTINTVRNLKDLMVSGVEPLNLMSQLACLITSILAGGYNIPKARQRRKFFRKKQLAKEDMERLRQALKTLSEAEKQLRGSSDRTTWLTAALLQFAPDQSYLLPSSSADTSVTESPAGVNTANGTPELNSLYSRQTELQPKHARSFEAGSAGTATEAVSNRMPGSPKASVSDARQGPLAASQAQTRSHKSRGSESGHVRMLSSTRSGELSRTTMWQTTLTNDFELEEVWQRVLDAVHSSSLRKFLQTQGKLLSLSLSKGFAVAILEFSQLESSSRAERSRTSIAHAFQVTLGYPVDVKVHLASTMEEQTKKQAISGDQPSGSSSLWQPAWISGDGKARLASNMAIEKNRQDDMKSRGLHYRKHQSLEVYRGPTDSKSQNTQKPNHSIEIAALETGRSGSLPAATINDHALEDKLESAWVQGPPGNDFFMRSSSKTEMHHEAAGFKANSTGKNRVSLGFVIQQAEGSVEGYSQDLEFDHMNEGSNQHLRHRDATDFGDGGSTAAHEMAARLEEENLRLESRSGGLLCWKVTDRGHEKQVKQFQESPKRPGFLLSLCPCAKSNHS